jgi:copper(I)-binding protein
VRPAAAAGATDAYMQLMSAAGARVVHVGSTVAGGASLVAAQGGALQSLPLPAGVTVVLAPGRVRIRLSGLARALRLGDRVPLTLLIEAADGTTQSIAIDAEVRRRSPTDDHRQPHRH